jgi:midasin (ATPase involved in ribosome maturation)
MTAPFELKMTEQEAFDGLKKQFGTEFTTPEVRAFCAMNDIAYGTVTRKIAQYKVSKGKWNLTLQEKLEKTYEAPSADPVDQRNLVPDKDPNYVPFGNYTDVKKIIQSKIFYPTFITGLSGNGKTFSVEQACAALNRELIRVNITIETDEDDLIGGFRLINGETVWHNGPVIEALERGAVLLLDEVDLASNKILCLQSILEGKGVFLKKIGKFISPSSGFNIIATANTKGKGSDDGRFIGTNVLNEAFLERFAVTFEQEYPSVSTETKILQRVAAKANVDAPEFCKRLVDWADIIRKTFYDGGIDEVISTRRLVHIVHSYKIFTNKEKAIQVCINRFDDETKQSFLELYDKVDVEFQISKSEVNDEPVEKL